MSKKKIIKTVIICVVLVAFLAGLIAMMALPHDFSGKDRDALDIANSSFGERILIGLQVALLGIGTVFIMLILLIIVVTLMKLIFQGVGKLKEKSIAKKSEAMQNQIAVVEEEVALEEEDEEIVAVIMAAINAYYETQNVTYKSNLKFRVRSIKEI